MLLTKTVKIKWNPRNKKCYVSKGYIFTKMGDEFEVNVEDLSNGSHTSITVLCDYCLEEGKETILPRSYKQYIESREIIQKDCCGRCQSKKTKESNFINYGVESTNQVPEIIEKKRITKTYSQEYINEEFIRKGLILVGKYKQSDIPVEFICPIHQNKGIQTIRYANLQQGAGCKYCAREKIANLQRHSQEYVEAEFAKRDYILLDTYINMKKPMRYICKKHPDKIQKMTYGSLYSGKGCPICGRIKANKSNAARHSYDFANKEFSDHHYKLLTEKNEYENMQIKMDYVCEKHPEYIQKISVTNLLCGCGGCYYCGLEKLRGENNPNWQGGITPLLLHLRRTIFPWYLDTIKYYNYKCVITGKPFGVVHHYSRNFSDIVKDTLSELNLPILKNVGSYTKEQIKLIEDKCLELHYKYGLGVCLTKEKHIEFHKIYKKKNNTKEQFDEFLNNCIKEGGNMGDK